MSTLPQSLDNSHVTFLIGRNGSGKSRRLRELALQAVHSGRSVIAISNTVFDRLPSRHWDNYTKLSPAAGKKYALNVFKAALCHESDEFRTFRQIEKVLRYAGYESIITAQINLKRNITQREFQDRVSVIESIDSQTIAYLLKILEAYDSFEIGSAIVHIDFHSSTIFSAGILEFIRKEGLLRQANVLQNISIHLHKDGKSYPLHGASSGELTLLANYAFLSTHLKDQTIVFIDEPENSLHPKWQSDYCRNLLDQFYLYRPKLVVATHAPMVVSGAISDEVGSQVFVMPEEREESIDAISIDGLLLEVFGILPPASHYLSEKVSQLLNELQLGVVSLHDAYAELDRLSDISYDERQKKFLSETHKLAEEINNYRSAEKNNNET